MMKIQSKLIELYCSWHGKVVRSVGFVVPSW